MKPAHLQSLSFLAVVASALLLPVSLPAAGFALTASGLAAVLLADYGHQPARYAAALADRRRPKFASPYAA